MKPLEDELRSLLRREEPPAGFTGRVLGRLKDARERKNPLRRLFDALALRPVPRWAAAGALACLLLGVAYTGYRGREERKGELARAEAVEALRIASAELNATLEKVVLNGPVSHSPGRESE